MTETPDDLLAPDDPETGPSPAEREDGGGDDAQGLNAEESLGLLPPD